MSTLRHPHIVQILDFNVTAEGVPFLVMELLEGWPLTGSTASGPPFEPRAAVHIVGQIAHALAAAHAHGIVHLDLKPDNVILVPTDGRGDFVKVIDFGISQAIWRERLATDPLIAGTPEYMAPEQAGGMTEEIDHRADQFCLGVALLQAPDGPRALQRRRPVRHPSSGHQRDAATALATGAFARRGGGRSDSSRNVQAPGRSLPRRHGLRRRARRRDRRHRFRQEELTREPTQSLPTKAASPRMSDEYSELARATGRAGHVTVSAQDPHARAPATAPGSLPRARGGGGRLVCSGFTRSCPQSPAPRGHPSAKDLLGNRQNAPGAALTRRGRRVLRHQSAMASRNRKSPVRRGSPTPLACRSRRCRDRSGWG